ncbi:hypothetical protein SLEP1_g8411 [Rubroshorea leprosula]|uniref:Heat shock protein 70 n=1 Tax=Rubroshorea leprosula TaxID=152421 RepID=A0AAV5IAM9_9ROSI|nr:hypothetical protein SLEP1_g8411 [Rubroshorea leprosula]
MSKVLKFKPSELNDINVLEAYELRFTSNSKASLSTSPLVNKWATLARPFNSRLVGNDVIGVDMGTTNSCVLVMEGKSARVIENAKGARTTPSIVAFNQQKELIVGTPAKCQAITNPTNTLQATKDASRIAGLDVQRIINEPTTTILSYGLNNKEGIIAVFDLGGGTFDVSILEISNSVFEWMSSSGYTTLISQRTRTLQRLREVEEKAKIEVSSTTQTKVTLPIITADASKTKHLNITLTRSKFEGLVSRLIERTRDPCKNCVKDARISLNEVDEVLLVGGMTSVPKVQKVVAKIFGKALSKGVNPNKAFAMEAAIQGGILQGDVKELLLLDVTPLSLGIETLDARCWYHAISKPTCFCQGVVFSTAVDNQTQVGIKVLQGERQMVADNKLLGEFDLVGIPSMPRGLPQIEVTFDIDVNGIVTIFAKDKATNKEQQITIQSFGGLLDDETNKMSLGEYKSKILDEVTREIGPAVEDLRKVMAGDKAEEIKAKLDGANKAVSKIGEHMSRGFGSSSLERSQGSDEVPKAKYQEAIREYHGIE